MTFLFCFVVYIYVREGLIPERVFFFFFFDIIVSPDNTRCFEYLVTFDGRDRCLYVSMLQLDEFLCVIFFFCFLPLGILNQILLGEGDIFVTVFL